MRDRINQPRQQAAIVGQNVTVVQRDRFRPTRGQCVAHAVPNVTPFAELLRREPRLLQPRINGFQPRPVVPQYAMVLREIGKKTQRLLVLILIRPIEPDHNLGQIGNRFQLLNNGGQRRRVDLGIQ